MALQVATMLEYYAYLVPDKAMPGYPVNNFQGAKITGSD